MNIDFAKGNGLVPAIVQDAKTYQVLMLGYMNEEALQQSRATGRVTFYSRSKQRLWTKGETSGNYLELVDIQVDCDQDTLLVLANPNGPVCHTGTKTCFGEGSASFIHTLEAIIEDRYTQMPEGSYTTSLFQSGINRIAQKVGEEAVELVIESKDDNIDKFNGEAADLIYHLLVLLKHKGITLKDIEAVLAERHRVG